MITDSQVRPGSAEISPVRLSDAMGEHNALGELDAIVDLFIDLQKGHINALPSSE